jgi:hypothetical protein
METAIVHRLFLKPFDVQLFPFKQLRIFIAFYCGQSRLPAFTIFRDPSF